MDLPPPSEVPRRNFGKTSGFEDAFLKAVLLRFWSLNTFLLLNLPPARKPTYKMKQNRPLSTLFLLAIALVRVPAFGEQATIPSPPDPLTKQSTILQSVTRSRSLSNGIEIRSGEAVMQIT